MNPPEQPPPEAVLMTGLLSDFTTEERGFLLGYMACYDPDLLFRAIERMRDLGL